MEIPITTIQDVDDLVNNAMDAMTELLAACEQYDRVRDDPDLSNRLQNLRVFAKRAIRNLSCI